MGSCFTRHAEPPIAPSTLTGPVHPPILRSRSSTRMSRATKTVTMTNVKPGQCKFSGFLVVTGATGNLDTKPVTIEDGVLKLAHTEVSEEGPKVSAIYLRLFVKELKLVMTIGPSGLEEKNANTQVEVKLLPNEAPAIARGELIGGNQSIQIAKASGFLSEMDGMYVLEDFEADFDGHTKIEGSASWRLSRETNVEGENDEQSKSNRNQEQQHHPGS